jgi:hypothetical protein
MIKRVEKVMPQISQRNNKNKQQQKQLLPTIALFALIGDERCGYKQKNLQ